MLHNIQNTLPSDFIKIFALNILMILIDYNSLKKWKYCKTEHLRVFGIISNVHAISCTCV